MSVRLKAADERARRPIGQRATDPVAQATTDAHMPLWRVLRHSQALCPPILARTTP